MMCLGYSDGCVTIFFSCILAFFQSCSFSLSFSRMKKKFYSWDECMNLREVKVRREIFTLEQAAFFVKSVKWKL